MKQVANSRRTQIVIVAPQKLSIIVIDIEKESKI